MRSQSTRRWTRLLALLLGLAMVAAACGGDDDDSASDDDDGGSEQGDTGAVENEPDGDGDPVAGGKLVYGLDAAASSPWTPANVVCDPSCHKVMRTVFETLTVTSAGDDPEPLPYLLESFSANEDFTEWTLVPREGITFHDGTPFDAEAIKVNLEAFKTSFLTGNALLDLESVEVVDGNAVAKTSRPWAHFPIFLSGQTGYMASPTWLAAVADGSAEQDEPVGTGPFVFQSYEPAGSFIATKNADYWRADEGLPYLDEVELRVIADIQSRQTALLNGDIDMMMTSNGDAISQLRGEDGIETFESDQFGEKAFTLLNVNNPDSAIQDVRIRRALAFATDNQVLIDRRGGGVPAVSNGPFGAGQIGELDDTGYPEFDQDAARALVEEYKADNGISGDVPISYTTTSDPFNLGTAELVKQFWDAVGFETEVAQIEQSQFIVTALQGDFEAFGWRNHGGYNPDSQRYWWHSEAAVCGIRDTCPDGGDPGLALNFGRIRDDVIDGALDALRESDDPAVVQEQAEIINRQFGEQAYNLWSSETVWMWAKVPAVNGLGSWETPEGGGVGEAMGVGPAHGFVQLWCDDGSCS